MIDTTITVRNREQTGTGPNRRLRQTGEIPAVVYGTGRPPVAIQIQERTVQKLLRDAGENAVFLLQLEGSDQSRNAMIRDIQYEPHTGRLVHIDFMRINMDQAVEVSVPVEIEGTAAGVKNEGGILDFILHEVEISCLPNQIPQQLLIDVTELSIGDTVDTTGLQLPEGVTLVDEEPRVIAAVNHPQVAEEVEEEEGELLEAVADQPEIVGENDDAESS